MSAVSRRFAWTMVAAAMGCLAAAVTIQVLRDRAFPRITPQTEAWLYVRSPEAVGRLALGFDALAADVYWIRALQHYGADRLSKIPTGRRYELLYPLLDLTTSLDPYFNIAYRFGAIFLSEPYPGGAGRPDRAIQLLRKGIVNNPGKWHYYHDIAFIHYWTLNDRAEAAAWFRRAAEQPGAPNWLLPIAAAMLMDGTDRASSRYLWQQILRSDEAWLRHRAERALLQIDALEQIDKLEPLLRSGRLMGMPLDPTGTPYEIDRARGEIRVSPESPLFPMPLEGETR